MNPAGHARVYGRLAYPAALRGYSVAVVGRKGSRTPAGPIKTVELDYRGRGRLLNHAALINAAIGLKARIYHVHSPELLPLAAVLKKIRGAKIVYDVHENYVLNALTAGGYRFRQTLAAAVAKVEIRFAPMLDGVVLAEKSFWDLPFLSRAGGPVVACPNYFAPPAHAPSLSPEYIASLGEYLLYTGTLSEKWGTDAAVRAAKKMGAKIVVAGHTHNGRYFERLRRLADGANAVFIGGTRYVDYADIVALIAGCRAGFALYHPDPNLVRRRPTKFFEYAAFGKPLYYTDAWADERVYGVPVPFPADDFSFPPPPPPVPPRPGRPYAPFDPVDELYRRLLNG